VGDTFIAVVLPRNHGARNSLTSSARARADATSEMPAKAVYFSFVSLGKTFPLEKINVAMATHGRPRSGRSSGQIVAQQRYDRRA
jgi:hypothetical protein